jgi:L-ascorbate metabolism protein UlaG (beta-lactamase superfamily)
VVEQHDDVLGVGVGSGGVERPGRAEPAAVESDHSLAARELGHLGIPHAHVQREAVHEDDGRAVAGHLVDELAPGTGSTAVAGKGCIVISGTFRDGGGAASAARASDQYRLAGPGRAVTRRYCGRMRLRKLGHSCLLAAGDGYRLLIDPGCFASGLADLRDLTAVLVTHSHDDHLDTGLLRAVLAGNPSARVIADEASAATLAGCGVSAEPVREGDVLELGTTVSVHGREHAVIHPDLPNVPNVGYLIADQLFCAGDAFTNPGRPVDILAVPVGAAWMKVSEAVDWLRAISPRIAVPVHDHGDVFAEWIGHLFASLGPAETTVLPLDGLPSTEL